MNTTLPPLGEITARGERIYEERIKAQLEPEYHGQFAVIHVETGEFELGATQLEAVNRAKLRWPGYAPLYSKRIGFGAVGRIGGRLLRKPE